MQLRGRRQKSRTIRKSRTSSMSSHLIRKENICPLLPSSNSPLLTSNNSPLLTSNNLPGTNLCSNQAHYYTHYTPPCSSSSGSSMSSSCSGMSSSSSGGSSSSGSSSNKLHRAFSTICLNYPTSPPLHHGQTSTSQATHAAAQKSISCRPTSICSSCWMIMSKRPRRRSTSWTRL